MCDAYLEPLPSLLKRLQWRSNLAQTAEAGSALIAMLSGSAIDKGEEET